MKKTKHRLTLLMLAGALALAGCAGPFGTATSVQLGDTEPQVVSSLGKPAMRYSDGNETVLIYPRGPFGQQTYVAHFGPDNKLRSYEQVLTMQKFGTIKIGEDNKQTIMRNFGPPAETSYLALPKLEVWSYRYKENNAWNSMMHVHFDQAGIVRKIQNGPDPWYDDRRRLFF